MIYKNLRVLGKNKPRKLNFLATFLTQTDIIVDVKYKNKLDSQNSFNQKDKGLLRTSKLWLEKRDMKILR